MPDPLYGLEEIVDTRIIDETSANNNRLIGIIQFMIYFLVD